MLNSIHTRLLPAAASGAQGVPLLALYAVLILTPSTAIVPWIQSSYDEKRLLQVLVLLAVGVAMLVCARTARSCSTAWAALPRLARGGILSVLGLGVASSLLATTPRYGLLETSHWGLLLCAALWIAGLFRDTRGRLITGFSWALTVSALLYLVTFMAAFLAARLSAGSLEPALLLPGFYNIRFLSQYQTWTLPLLVLPLVTPMEERAGRKALARVALAGWWGIAFVSEGRGTLVAVAGALAVCALLFRGAARPMLKEQMLAAALGLALYATLFVAPTLGVEGATSAPLSATETAGLNRRGELWEHALTMTGDHPWLGVGPLHYGDHPNPLAAHPHNALLQWSAEWGFPATLLSAALLAWGLCCWAGHCRGAGAQRAPGSERQLAVVLTATVLAGAVHAMVSGIIVMPLSQLMLAAVVGLMLGHYHGSARRTTAARPPPWKARLLGALLVALTLTLLLPDLVTGLGGHGENLEPTLSAGGPRYWMVGDFPR